MVALHYCILIQVGLPPLVKWSIQTQERRAHAYYWLVSEIKNRDLFTWYNQSSDSLTDTADLLEYFPWCDCCRCIYAYTINTIMMVRIYFSCPEAVKSSSTCSLLPNLNEWMHNKQIHVIYLKTQLGCIANIHTLND